MLATESLHLEAAKHEYIASFSSEKLSGYECFCRLREHEVRSNLASLLYKVKEAGLREHEVRSNLASLLYKVKEAGLREHEVRSNLASIHINRKTQGLREYA